MTNNEDQKKYEEMTIEKFLRTEASTVPGKDILTWKRKGKDYYARYEDDSKTHVQITFNMNAPSGVRFLTEALMAQIYEHLD